MRNLVKTIMNYYPKVGDCLIVQSSHKTRSQIWRYSRYQHLYAVARGSNFHLVFSNYIGLNLSYRIIDVLAGLDVLNWGYMKIREFRGDMTIRVSHVVTTEGLKPPPEPVEYIKNKRCETVHDGITRYLDVLLTGQSLFLADFNTKNEPYNSSNRTYDDAKIITVDTADQRGRFQG